MINVLTYKCNSSKSPAYLRNLLSYTYDCNDDHNTRNASNHLFHIPKLVNCEKFRESYCYQASKTGMPFLLK